jgi:hypothetical protein
MSMKLAPDELDDAHYKVAVSLSGSLHNTITCGGEEPYVTPLVASVWEERWNDGIDGVDRLHAGNIHGLIFHVRLARQHGVSLQDAAIIEGDDAVRFAAQVFTKVGSRWRKPIVRQFGSRLRANSVFAFTKVSLEREYMDRQVGLLTLIRVLQMFDEPHSLAIIRPWEMPYAQYELDRSADSTDANVKPINGGQVEPEQMIAYWDFLGFEPIGDAEFYVRTGDKPLPTLDMLRATNHLL